MTAPPSGASTDLPLSGWLVLDRNEIAQLTGRGATGAAGTDSRSATCGTTPNAISPIGIRVGLGQAVMVSALFDPALTLAADVLEDLEQMRMACESRIRQFTKTAEDADGQTRGFGVDESHPTIARLVAAAEVLKRLEHDAEVDLKWHMRHHPLFRWVRSAKGVGEKQAARLLGAIGDPYINSAKGCPRTVSALWAYAGLHVVTDGDVGVSPKLRRGQPANWSSKARFRALLVAEQCVLMRSVNCRDTDGTTVHAARCRCSPYRLVYEQRRKHTAVTHPEWTDAHSHNDALRVTAKAVLRDLWRAAKRIHEGSPDLPPRQEAVLDAMRRAAMGPTLVARSLAAT